jgi:tRNA G18 (ribose-2'-O)-methylase SpoU
MMHDVISDPADGRVAAFANLPARGDVRSDTIIVESVLAVRRLLQHGVPTRAILVVDTRAAQLQVPADVAVFTCAKPVLDQIVGFPMHRGALAIADRPRTPLTVLIERLQAPRSLVVCVSGVSDPANLGAIARNCRGLGAAGLLVDPRGGDIYARKSIRTSMGNIFALPVVVEELASAIATLRRNVPDLVVAAATLSQRSRDLRTYARPARVLLILGNEGAGIPADVLALADTELCIPMHNGTDSLNVAAASAVFLYALGFPAQ